MARRPLPCSQFPVPSTRRPSSAGMVRAAMAQAVVLPEISRASLANEYNFTDPTTRTYRYQAVFELTYYEGEI